MNIRDRYTPEEKPTAAQQRDLKELESMIINLEQKDDYRDKIGADKILINGQASIHVSAFNNEVLSGFITELMYHVSGSGMSLTFSKKNLEGFLNPVFTNIIKLEA